MKYVKRKTLLYRSGVEFEDYALNHIEGCTHDCRFPCYARLFKKRSPSEWVDIAIVENAMELLDIEIPVLKDRIKQVHMCFSTDPFMYGVPEVIELSLKIIRRLINENIKVKTLTKGETPYKEIIDIEKARPENYGDLFNVIPKKENEYGITLVNLNEEYRKKYEPGTAPFDIRINSLKKLADAGYYTYVYMEPFNPWFTSMEHFDKMLNIIKFVKKIYFGSWQNNPKYAPKEPYRKYVYHLVDFCKENNIELFLKREVRFLYEGSDAEKFNNEGVQKT